MIVTETAPAKLNLFLNIVGRRADGYHLLDSLFAFVGCADTLTFQASPNLALGMEGPFAAALGDEDNLVLKAARLLAAEAGLEPNGRLNLVKNVPVAAGVGGGSADAAAALRLLNYAWALDWPLERLLPLAARLGADVPACLASRPTIARGVGDRLHAAPALPPCGVLLVNPRVATPTPDVFRAFRARNPTIAPRDSAPMPARFENLAAFVATIAPRGNDLLEPALQVTPAIGEVLSALRALPAVAHAGLSGSGATCFALFEAEAHAAEARKLLPRDANWWSWSGTWFDSAAGRATLT